MRLQKKITLVMVITVVILLVAQLLVSEYLTEQELTDLEQDRMFESLEKIEVMVDREIEHLAMLSEAWAEVGGCVIQLSEDKKNASEEIEDRFLLVNKLNLVLLYDKDGIKFDGKSFNLVSGYPMDIEEQFAKKLPVSHILLNHGVRRQKISGIYVVGGIPMLIASSPVYEQFDKKSDMAKVGTIIIGRFLSSDLLRVFSSRQETKWRILNLDDKTSNIPRDKISTFPLPKPIVIYMKDKDKFQIYASAPTLNDKRGMLLRIEVSGNKLQSASARLSLLFNVSAAIGLLAFIIFVMYFTNYIVKPIRDLTKQIQAIRRNSFVNIKLDYLRKDEFGVLALEFDKLLEQLNNRSEEMALLGSLDNLLAACSSISEAGEVFSKVAVKLLSNCNGALAIINNSGNHFEIKISWGGEWPGETVFSQNDCWALRRGQVHSMAEGSSSPVCKHMLDSVENAVICIPLVAQGDTLGVLHVMTKSEFNETEIQLAESLAKHTSLALANLRLREALHVQAVRDPLTGLYNRRYLEESIERELSRAKRENSTVGVFMIDLDHFKRFNDDFGHEAGDYVLKQLGLVLRQVTRNEDIACRYGGEEFTVILPGASLEICKERGEELCERLRKMDLRYRDKELGIVTLSIGVGMSPDHGENGEAVLAAADRALYRAKANGRDRVEIAT